MAAVGDRCYSPETAFLHSSSAFPHRAAKPSQTFQSLANFDTRDCNSSVFRQLPCAFCFLPAVFRLLPTADDLCQALAQVPAVRRQANGLLILLHCVLLFTEL